MKHLEMCPGCRRVRSPRGSPCPQCWKRIPTPLKRAYANAYRARVQQPVRFQEETIALLQWCRNNRFG
jgi:hypothetical protein